MQEERRKAHEEEEKVREQETAGKKKRNYDDEEEKKTSRDNKKGEEYDEEEDTGFLDDAPKYYQPGIVPQAPLKPSQKDAYDAFISKLFNPYLPLDEQKELYMKPLPALIGQV